MAVSSHLEELSVVRGASVRLGQRLARTAGEISSGSLPAVDWLDDLRGYRQSLDSLKQKLDCDQASLTDISLVELEHRLAEQQTLEAARERLTQLMETQSVDGREIPALAALHTRCRALLHREASQNQRAEIVSVLDELQPLGALWMFLSSQESLADDAWQSLLEVMSRSLSRELVTCVTRGRIRLGIASETDTIPLPSNHDTASSLNSPTGDSDS